MLEKLSQDFLKMLASTGIEPATLPEEAGRSAIELTGEMRVSRVVMHMNLGKAKTCFRKAEIVLAQNFATEATHHSL